MTRIEGAAQEEIALLLLKLEEDGLTLTDEEQERLETLLGAGRESREKIVAHAMISGELIRGLRPTVAPANELRRPSRGSEVPARRKASRRWMGLGAIAALALLVGMSLLVQRARQVAQETVQVPSPDPTVQEPQPEPDQATMRELHELAASLRIATGGRPEAPPRLGAVAAAPAPPRIKDTFSTLVALPSEHLVYLRAGKPDARGLFGGNEIQWTCAGSQRAVLNTMMAGAVLGKPDWVEEGWRVIEATFAHQTDEGHFNEVENRYRSRASCAVMFMCNLVAALDVLERSSFGPRYTTRIAGLRPALARVGSWLSRPELLAALSKNRGAYVDLTIPTLASLAGLATRLEDTEMRQHALSLADVVASRVRPDGSFDHQGGFDSARQAHGLAILHLALPYLADHEPLRAAVDRGGRWAAGRVLPSGDLDLRGNQCFKPLDESPKCKGMNYMEIRRGMLMHALRFDSSAHEVSDRLLDRQLHRRR